MVNNTQERGSPPADRPPLLT